MESKHGKGKGAIVIKFQKLELEISRLRKPHIFRKLQCHGGTVYGRQKNKVVCIGCSLPVVNFSIFSVHSESGKVRMLKCDTSKLEKENKVVPKGVCGHGVFPLSDSKILIGMGETVGGYTKEYYTFDLQTRILDTIEFKGTWEVPRDFVNGYSWNYYEPENSSQRFLVMFGGSNSLSSCNDINILDLDTMEWKRFSPKYSDRNPDIPPRLCDHTSLIHEDHLYIFGGRIFRNARNEGYNRNVYVFNLLKRCWVEQLKTHDDGMFGGKDGIVGASCVVYKNRYFVIVGGEAAKTDVIVYDTLEQGWYWDVSENLTMEGDKPIAEFLYGSLHVVKHGNDERMIMIGGHPSGIVELEDSIVELCLIRKDGEQKN